MLLLDSVVYVFVGYRPLPPIRQHSEINVCVEDNMDNCHFLNICTIIIGSSYNFRFKSLFLCFIKLKLYVKVKLFVLLLCVCAILPGKAVPEMTYAVSGGMLNPTHSLTHLRGLSVVIMSSVGVWQQGEILLR